MIRIFNYIDVFYLVAAVRWTILLAVIAFIGAMFIGLIVMIIRMLQVKPLQWLCTAYVHIVQGTPLLVWLFLLYFGVAMLGLDINAWFSAALAFSIYGGAFLCEIWRGAVMSVERTQWESGASLGLSFLQQLRYIVIPQSIRVAIPPTAGFLVQMIKNTSLASTIGIVELTREGQMIAGATYASFSVYITVAILYFLLCFPLSQWSRYLERKYYSYR